MFAMKDDEKERLLSSDDINAIKTTGPNSNENSDKIVGSQGNSDTSKYSQIGCFLLLIVITTN